jgi:NADH-ubiquinone oxidoreductase-F iron-sulfur binding region
VLFGGAAGAFATTQHLDVRMTFEDLRAAGLPLGSGVVMVFNEKRDLRDVLMRLGKFFAHESCGKCYPCQMGSQRQMEILDRVAIGGALPGDFIRLQDVGWTMTDASLCGLGQTAASAILSAMKLWPALFEPQRSKNTAKVKTIKKPFAKTSLKPAKKMVEKKSKPVKKKVTKPKAVKSSKVKLVRKNTNTRKSAKRK